MSIDTQPHLSDHDDSQVAAYHALSVSAVAGLVLGALSPAAMFDPTLWALPIAGILLCGWGLWRIARNAPALIGRKAALAGLLLSLFFGAAAATDWCARRMPVRRGARQFAGTWFEMLAQGKPRSAHQLTLHPRYRRTLDEHLEQLYHEGSRWREQYDAYIAKPLIAKLLDLGPQAEVRCRRTSGPRSSQRGEYVGLLYAVTHGEPGRRATIFVDMQLERLQPDNGAPTWRIVSTNESTDAERR